jgi:hypothetical protein
VCLDLFMYILILALHVIFSEKHEATNIIFGSSPLEENLAVILNMR